MEHYMDSLYYAKEGEFVLLDGQPYIGPYHIMKSGVPMTGTRHDKDSRAIFPIQGRKTSTMPNGLNRLSPNTTLDENQTFYDLLPELVNQPPVIIKSLAEASVPSIKPSSAAGTLSTKHMYLFPDGAVKVHSGVDIVLRVEAEQPDVFNVENGVLEIIPPNQGLTYEWYLDGERIKTSTYYTSLNASRELLNDTIVIKNMVPRFMGQYSCIVSNDIGGVEAGSIDLEVFNSDSDSLFYTNLVENPNGRGEDGSLSTQGWSTLTDSMISKQLTPRTQGLRDKSIVVDPMDQQFHWTKEMLFPRPYQLNPGVLANNPIDLKRLTSYFTRDQYNYATSGGTKIAQIYQDIDLTELREQIRGSIYGVDGVTALISFYIGNGIYNYEPARPYITPDQRALLRSYYRGAARLSLENFIKMGPGFVKEKAYVKVEEFDNETRLVSLDRGVEPIVTLDPWNARLSKYNNQLYPSEFRVPNYKANNIDRHLYVADELFPTQKDRYTYGQYAEFQRIVLNKLNPRTTKLRLTFTIESEGQLNFIINEMLTDNYKPSRGIFETVGWQQSWESGYQRSEPSGEDQDKPWRVIENEYRTNTPWPDGIEQRMPKQSVSRAFATGFNVTLIPTGSAQNNQFVVDRIYTRNTSAASLVESPVSDKATVFDPFDTGERLMTMTFMMDSVNHILGIQMEGVPITSVDSLPEQIESKPGLMPFDASSQALYIERTVIKAKNYVRLNPAVGQRAGQFPPDGYNQLVPPFIDAYPTITLQETNQQYVSLTKGVEYFQQGRVAPEFPVSWYSIDKEDRLRIYRNMVIDMGQEVMLDAPANDSNTSTTDPPNPQTDKLPLQYDYQLWSVPGYPLALQDYMQNWVSKTSKGPNFAFSKLFSQQIPPVTSTWNEFSRFIITIGVHDTRYSMDSNQSLYAIDNYYLDIDGNTVTFHKNRNTGGAVILPAFDEFEKPTDGDERLFLESGNNANGIRWRALETDAGENFPEDVSIYSFQKAKIDMVPIESRMDEIITSPDMVASIKIPQELYTRQREQGGLNVPLIAAESESLDSTNVVDGTEQFTQGVTQENLINYNINEIRQAIEPQIQPLYDDLTENQKNYFDNYYWNLPADNGLQTTPIPPDPNDIPQSVISLSQQVGSDLPIRNWINANSKARQPIPQDSAIMTLGRRRWVLERTYEFLLRGDYGSTQADAELKAYGLTDNDITKSVNTGKPPIPFATLQAKVLEESNIAETLAPIYTTTDTLVMDPMYKPILYGVRPVPLGKVRGDATNAPFTTDDRMVGTPLQGIAFGAEYILKDIVVKNTGSLKP